MRMHAGVPCACAYAVNIYNSDGCLLTLRCLAGPILSRFYQQNLETASHNVSKYPLQIVFYQQFDDLYTFQGRPVTDIVGTYPETKSHAVIAARQLMDTQIV